MPIAIHTLVFGADPETAFAVESPSSISFMRVGDERSLIAALQEGTPAGYIAAHRLDHEVRSVVNRVRLAVPDAHVVVGLEDAEPVPGVRPIVCDRTVTVAPLPDRIGLRSAVVAALFEARRAELFRRLVEAPYHWLVKRALRCILEQDLGSGACPMHTINQVAARCGTDRAGMWRARQHQDLDLRRFIFLWVAALALWRQFIDGGETRVSWSKIARQCGYAETPGLTDLFTREFGHGPRAATLLDLWRVLDRLESMLGGASEEQMNES